MARLSELRRPTTIAEVVVVACAVAATVLLVAVAGSTLQRARTFESLRADRLQPASEREHAAVVQLADEPVAAALRQAQRLLAPGERFALLVAPDVERSTAGTYRLLSNQSLFPALATDDVEAADVIVAVGDVPHVDGIRLVLSLDGAWVGQRS